MELTPSEERKLKKISKFLENNEIATVDSFIELEDKVDSIAQSVDSKLIGIQEELKKKLESELVLEIDREELRGEDGEDGLDGEDYILTDEDLNDIAKKVKVPVVEKVIEKTEVIRETPIVTEIVKEVAVADSAEEIRNKLEILNGDDRLAFSAIKESDSIIKDITALKARPVQFENGRGAGGGNIEVFEDNVKRGSGSAINFGAGFDVIHDGHKATVTLDGFEPTSFDLQSVTDNGATTTNVITGKAQPTFTYTSGKLTSIAYTNGTSKALTYNGDSTLHTLTITYPDTSTVVKTFNWSSGLLSSITIV